MTLLKELIDIPEHLGKGDFVFTLEDAVENPEQVLGDYVVTPQLQESFDEALDQIESAINSRESRASYLHGSFGSGKSHFMAVLYLLLSHVPEARAVPELQKCVADHDDWLADKNFLLIPVHMINADVERLEEAVIAAYVERVEALHPGAGLPAVYQSAPIFENADDLLGRLGEDAFFEAINDGSSGKALASANSLARGGTLKPMKQLRTGSPEMPTTMVSSARWSLPGLCSLLTLKSREARSTSHSRTDSAPCRGMPRSLATTG